MEPSEESGHLYHSTSYKSRFTNYEIEMPEHYTRNTETATAWCNKCNRMTVHRIDGGRKGPCLEHDTPVKEKKPKRPAESQKGLFDKS